MATRTARRIISSRAAWLAVAGPFAILLLAWVISRFDLLTAGGSRLAAELRALGWVGPPILVLLLVTQAVVAPIPAPPILATGGFVYGPFAGCVIGAVGLLAGASACFLLARTLGRPFVERFVTPTRLAALDARLASRSGTTFLTIVSLRVFLPPLFDAVSYACGLVELPFVRFAAATALGEMPKVVSFTYLGAAAGGPPAWLVGWIWAAPIVGLLMLWLARRRADTTTL